MKEMSEAAAAVLQSQTPLPSSCVRQLAIPPSTICPRKVSPGPLPASVLVITTDMSLTVGGGDKE